MHPKFYLYCNSVDLKRAVHREFHSHIAMKKLLYIPRFYSVSHIFIRINVAICQAVIGNLMYNVYADVMCKQVRTG